MIKTPTKNFFIILLFFFLFIPSYQSIILPISSESNQPSFYDSDNYDMNQDASKLLSIIENINESLLKSYLVPLVAFGPRYTGTYGCQKSAAFIYHQFQELGLQTRYQNWTDWGNKYHPKLFKSQNVEGVLPGKTDDQWIIFGAHYDTVKGAPGANDDGSGVAAVLAAASVLSKYDFNHTLAFVTFSGEEIGLRGSWAYAQELYRNKQAILFDFNADMIGRATTTTGGSRMGITITEDATFIPSLFETVNTIAETNLEFNRGTITRDGRGWSDYYPFCYYGYESVACWQGEHDPNMHTPEDTLDNVNFSYLVKTTKMIAGSIATLADTMILPSQIKITSPEQQSLYYKGQKLRDRKRQQPTILIDDFWFWAEPLYESTLIQKVEFYFDETLVHTDTAAPFKWQCNIRSFGSHRIKVRSFDTNEIQSEDFIDVIYLNPILN